MSDFPVNSELLNEYQLLEKRLCSEDFRGCRCLFRNAETLQTGTTYEDLFVSDFRDYILSSKKVLDLGAGSGRAGLELKSQSRCDDLVLHASTYSDCEDTRKVLNDIYDHVFYGDVVKGAVCDGAYNAVMDSYGAFSYTLDMSGLIEEVARLLAVGGRYYTVFDQFLYRWIGAVSGEGLSIVDKEQHDILQKWFGEIRGLRLLSHDTHRAYDDFLKIFAPKQVKYVYENGYTFIKTPVEEINFFASIVFERTDDEIYVPPLRLFSFKDGRPPERSFIRV